MVRIFHNHNLIAVHERSFVKGKYTTEKNHLCSTHQHYLNRSPQYYKDKARNLSEPLGQLVELIFSQDKYPEQLYRSCDGLFSLQRNTHPDSFNKACQMAIEHQNYSYGFVQNIIKNKMAQATDEKQDKALPEHNNIRGRNYFNKKLSI